MNAARTPRAAPLALAALLVTTTVVSALATLARPPEDEGVYLFLRALGLPAATVTDLVGSAPALALLGLLGLLGQGCRALAAAVPGAVLAAPGVALALGALLGRPRPTDSPLPGHDSYPSAEVAGLAAAAVLLPVAVRVLTRSRVAAGVVAGLLWLTVVGVAAGQVQRALHWPLDVLGGGLLGALAGSAVLVLLEAVPRLHERCDGCPWQAGSATSRAASGGPAPALRWRVAVTVLVVTAAAALGFIGSLSHGPAVAALAALAVLAASFRVWSPVLRGARLGTVLAAAGVSSVLLGALVLAAATAYTSAWGPTHPASATPAPPGDRVVWMWSGAVSDTSLTVKARTARDVRRVRLLVATEPDLTDAHASRPDRAVSAEDVTSLSVGGLEPATDYYYALELDGEVVRERIGHAATFPRDGGASSFSFVVGSCSRTGSDGAVYDAMRRTRPLFYLNSGDWFYGNVGRDDPDLVRRSYEANLTSPAQATLYASAPFAYVWDDHDYASNDADRASPSRPASMEVYRQYVPHYPLRGDHEAPIYQAFTVGDVRFLLTDNRSAREPARVPDRSMLGRTQRAWLLRELAHADDYGLVVWVNPAPWIDAADPGSDTWGGFAAERRAISDAIAEHRVDNLLMLSGDAHMLAYDDGTHSDYSGTGRAGFPVFHTAALDRKGSVKGGPYTGPVLPGGGHFGEVHVRDDGRTVAVTMVGRSWKGGELFTRRFTTTR